MQLRIEALNNSGLQRGFNHLRNLAITVRSSYQLSYEATDIGSW